MNQNLGIKEIKQDGDRHLSIVWTDNQFSKLDVVELRRRCPCAACVDEWSGEKRLKPEDVSDKVRPIKVDSVGRYALQIQFTDSHNTGIYTYKFLRELSSLS